MTTTENKNDFETEKLRLEYSFENGIDFKNRIIRLIGTVGDCSGPMFNEPFFTFDSLDAALTELESKSDESITLRLNSPGGSVYEGLAIVGRIKSSPCKITVEGYGHVMSAATLILACGNVRKISKYCISMFHQTSYGVSGSHEEIKEQVEQAEKEEKLWAKWLSELSGKSAKFWFQKVKKKNVYLTAEEMVKNGVADEVI